jgi:hypothetical protein
VSVFRSLVVRIAAGIQRRNAISATAARCTLDVRCQPYLPASAWFLWTVVQRDTPWKVSCNWCKVVGNPSKHKTELTPWMAPISSSDVTMPHSRMPLLSPPQDVLQPIREGRQIPVGNLPRSKTITSWSSKESTIEQLYTLLHCYDAEGVAPLKFSEPMFNHDKYSGGFLSHKFRKEQGCICRWTYSARSRFLRTTRNCYDCKIARLPNWARAQEESSSRKVERSAPSITRVDPVRDVVLVAAT